MPEPLNVSNTLVNQPVNYIGHNPYRWKWIGKWDSDTFLKDFYQNEELGVPQYDLICGEGIVIMDDVEGGQCGQTTTVDEKHIHVVFSYYNLEPADTITVCYVAKDVPLVDNQFDIFEHIRNCWNNLPSVATGDNDYSEIIQYFVFYIRCPVDTWIHETTIDQINVGDIHPTNHTCDGMWGCFPLFNFSATTTSRLADRYEYYALHPNSIGENPCPELILNKPTSTNNYIEEEDIGKLYINGYDNIEIYDPGDPLKVMVGVNDVPCFEASNGDLICHLHCLKEGWLYS